jgi:single-stranded DNA-binding protein
MITASIAVNVARPGEPEVTEWINLVAFGKAGEALARHQKGDLVAVMGPLTRLNFVARDGTERTSWSLTVDSLVSARTVRPGGRRPPSASPAARRETPRGAIHPHDDAAGRWAGSAQ